MTKLSEIYDHMIDDVPMLTILKDDEYDGVTISQDGRTPEHFPPKYILWLAARVREYYPDVKEYDPCAK